MDYRETFDRFEGGVTAKTIYTTLTMWSTGTKLTGYVAYLPITDIEAGDTVLIKFDNGAIYKATIKNEIGTLQFYNVSMIYGPDVPNARAQSAVGTDRIGYRVFSESTNTLSLLNTGIPITISSDYSVRAWYLNLSKVSVSYGRALKCYQSNTGGSDSTYTIPTTIIGNSTFLVFGWYRTPSSASNSGIAIVSLYATGTGDNVVINKIGIFDGLTGGTFDSSTRQLTLNFVAYMTFFIIPLGNGFIPAGD